MEQCAALQLERDIEQCLLTCIELYEDELYAQMSTTFSTLLAQLQRAQYIDYTFAVLVNTDACLPQARLLLKSLQHAQARKTHKRKLLTHRQILRVWLRQHKAFSYEFLPNTF